jgi:hypothetical protein
MDGTSFDTLMAESGKIGQPALVLFGSVNDQIQYLLRRVLVQAIPPSKEREVYMSTKTVDGSRQKLPCEVTRKEFAGEMLGVQGRFRDLVRHKSDQENQRIRNQKWFSEQRFYEENGVRYSIQVCVRHDDELLNGHPSFSITAEIRGPQGFEAGGCCHDDIARHFPELAGLIKWHQCSTDGPLHYVENTLYFAGDRELDAARRSAIWPEATHDELCAPEQVLRGMLEDRLPGLLSEFRSAIENAGLEYE